MREHWYLHLCPIHGLTEHLTVLDGECIKCRLEKDEQATINEDKSEEDTHIACVHKEKQ